MTQHFESLLDAPIDDIERPKPLPPGTYLTIISGIERGKSSKKGTDFIEFEHKLVAAQDDVDEGALKVWLDGESLENKTFRNTYYVTAKTAWRLKEFLEHCGIDADNGITLAEGAQMCENAEVYITVAHEPSQDGSFDVPRVVSTASAG